MISHCLLAASFNLSWKPMTWSSSEPPVTSTRPRVASPDGNVSDFTQVSRYWLKQFVLVITFCSGQWEQGGWWSRARSLSDGANGVQRWSHGQFW